MSRILVAGVGNIFLGDDGFGVEVARRLARRPHSSEVKVVDFGIRGFDLTYALMEDYDAVILIDATARGGQPGTLYELEPEVDAPSDPQDLVLQTHGMHPQKVLELVKAMGAEVRCLRLVGCEPEQLGTDEALCIGLSQPVSEAVEPAVAMVESLVQRFLGQAHA